MIKNIYKVDFKASKHGSLRTARFLYENGAKINEKDQDGRLPLHEAVKVSDFEIVKFLCESGSEINVKDIKKTDCLTIGNYRKNIIFITELHS